MTPKNQLNATKEMILEKALELACETVGCPCPPETFWDTDSETYVTEYFCDYEQENCLECKKRSLICKAEKYWEDKQ